ncbi:CHUR-like protein [Mya arenaria]|uniref:Protein Churchill n=1 Tax=Mya arenaria TaxID=6604 RepID=A0ABY7F7T7_MYAAR|nr:CHUR-like protein [Mya arenaria]
MFEVYPNDVFQIGLLATFTLKAKHGGMCRSCVKEEYPDRESVCLESGSYMMNYAGCSQCGESSAIVMVNKQTTEDEDGQEVITYQHICQSCSHVIANHEHVFHVEDDYQMCSVSLKAIPDPRSGVLKIEADVDCCITLVWDKIELAELDFFIRLRVLQKEL